MSGFVPSLFFAVAFILVYMRVNAINRKAQLKRRSRLIARGVESEGDWFDNYWRDNGYSRESSVAIAKVFAARLSCDYTNLRPTDRFDVELEFEGVHFLGLDEDDEMEMIESDLDDLLNSKAAEAFGPLLTLGDVIA